MYSNTYDRMPPILKDSSTTQDLLWISKHQQQHPSTYAHPLKNTIRLDSRGIRYKFDGKQWRPLCESPDGHECRNVVFRSSLCQKHFYKMTVYKRPYHKHGTKSSPGPYKWSESNRIEPRERKATTDSSYDQIDDSIEVIDHDDSIHEPEQEDDDGDEEEQALQQKSSSTSNFRFFSIDCDPHDQPMKLKSTDNDSIHRSENRITRLDSNNTESNLSIHSPMRPITDSIRIGIPPLTRTEEKSLANEMIMQLPSDVTSSMAEQWTHHRACEIVFDNYSQRLLSNQISPEWFYDFLLRNPRVPMHFHVWFSSFPSHLPTTDQLLEIKKWELGLISRSISTSSFPTTPPSSSSPSN